MKLNLGSYHPINKLSVTWNSARESGSEGDIDTDQVDCAFLICN